jgi:hypothetical protein
MTTMCYRTPMDVTSALTQHVWNDFPCPAYGVRVNVQPWISTAHKPLVQDGITVIETASAQLAFLLPRSSGGSLRRLMSPISSIVRPAPVATALPIVTPACHNPSI